MRRLIIGMTLALLVSGCGTFKRAFGVSDSDAGHQEATSASIWGTWVLAEREQADPTAFAGAERVELELEPGRFAVTAFYPGGPVTVRGTANLSDEGTLILTPAGDMAGDARTVSVQWRALAMEPGRPITLLASAADDALVFAPDDRALRPSSVWHRKEHAERAGTVSDTSRRP